MADLRPLLLLVVLALVFLEMWQVVYRWPDRRP